MQLQITVINPAIHQLIVSCDDEDGNHGDDDDEHVSDSSFFFSRPRLKVIVHVPVASMIISYKYSDDDDVDVCDSSCASGFDDYKL